MDKKHHHLLSILNIAFNFEGDMNFLAISTKQTESTVEGRPVHQVRVALTFKEGDGINPYYDGTDVFVIWDEEGIAFTREEEWATGPPLVEGSPVELAVGWVSELAEPFYISAEVFKTAQPSPHFTDGSDDTNDRCHEKE